jgi:hypothetical protein
VIVLAASSTAFKPNAEGHGGVTNEALESLGFCRDARDGIETGNLLTDILEQLTASAHFDGESLPDGSRRLLDKIDAVVELVDAAVNDDDEFFGFDFLDGTLGLIQNAVGIVSPTVAGILGTTNEQRSAWSACGQGLHSLQDFYSHSNWVEMGNDSPFEKLGTEELPPVPEDSRPCPDDPAVLDLDGDGGNILTTGYFDFSPSRHCELLSEPGKCRHGWDLAGCASGLNKDEPTRPNYATARAIAVAATRDYVQLILNRLEELSEDHVQTFKGNCSPTNETQVFFATNTLSGSCDTLDIEIDEVGRDYELHIELDDIDSVSLLDPSDVELADDDDVGSSSASIDLGDTPTAGTYTLEICGDSERDYSVELITSSTVLSYQFSFTRTAGARNEGRYPATVNQQPILGQSNEIFAELYGASINAQSVSFSFVSIEDGRVLKTFSLPIEEDANDGVTFFGEVTVDFADQFFLRVTGELINGDSFIRYFRSREYQAQYPEVQLASEEDTFQLGPDSGSVSFDFSVVNHDVQAHSYTLELQVLNNEGAYTGSIRSVSKNKVLDSDTVTLNSGESVVVSVELNVEDHDDIDFGDLIEMNFRARASGDNVVNSVDVVGQYVGCSGNPICNGNGVCDPETNECLCDTGMDCGDSDDDDDDFIPSASLPSIPGFSVFSPSPTDGSPATSFTSFTSNNSPSSFGGSPGSGDSSATATSVSAALLLICLVFVIA